MITDILIAGAKGTQILAASITKELIGEPKVDAQKYKCKEKIKEFEKLLSDKKDKLHKDRYFKYKTRLNSFHSELSISRDLDKLKKLEENIKSIISDIKK